MAGLKELRTRIEAIKSTQKITSAMKMVAASRLRRVQILVDHGQEYSTNLRRSALRVLADVQAEETEKNIRYIRPQLLQEAVNPQKYALYVFSSNRGLCGAYNNNVAKKAMARIQELQKNGKNITVICYGKKAYDILRRTYGDTDLCLNLAEDLNDEPSYAAAAEHLAARILDKFLCRDFDICEFVYAHFDSAISREFRCEQVCPLYLNSDHLSAEELAGLTRSGDAFYDYMPDKLTILTQILPVIFKDNVFSFLVNAAASEYGARMTSMDSATRNAKKMISELTLKYNSLRQSAITTELIEIIAGAEAI